MNIRQCVTLNRVEGAEFLATRKDLRLFLSRPAASFFSWGILFCFLLFQGCTAIYYARTAKSYTEKGQHDEAIENAKQGIALDPQYALNWYWLGVAYYRKGNYDEAIPAFKKVIELKPDGNQYWLSFYYLGTAYYIKGDYDEAIRDFNKAIELKPTDADSVSWRGTAYYRKGNYDEAIRDFNKAIELKPTDAFSLSWRGWAYYYKGNYDEAIRDFNKAIENVEPKEKDYMRDALRGKAFSYLGLGDKETALNLIKQAKSASDYDNNYDLSLIYYAMGDKEKAWEYRGGKGMVGVQVKDYKKGTLNGAEVGGITAGGPAEKANILVGDVIVDVDGIKITSGMDFFGKKLIPGAIVKIKVLREGIEKDINSEVASAEPLMESQPLIAAILKKNAALATEKNGENRKAFQLYLEALSNGSMDADILKRVIALYHKFDPKPSIPEEARKHAVFAMTAVKEAKDKSELYKAINEYNEALKLAPWWADLYLNAALVYEQQENPLRAAEYLKLFLLAAPNDPQAKSVQDKLYELEYKAKK